MNVKELKEVLKEMPDDALVTAYNAENSNVVEATAAVDAYLVKGVSNGECLNRFVIGYES